MNKERWINLSIVSVVLALVLLAISSLFCWAFEANYGVAFCTTLVTIAVVSFISVKNPELLDD